VIRFALLYPTPDAAEDDFIGLAARCDPPAQVVPVHFPWPEGAEDLTVLDTEQTYAAVREVGSDAHLERVTTVSTTSAFQHAVQHSGLTSVALASVYHPSATDHFIDRLAEVGATTISRVDADASSDRELATWSSDQIASLVRACVHDDAQAVVLPRDRSAHRHHRRPARPGGRSSGTYCHPSDHLGRLPSPRPAPPHDERRHPLRRSRISPSRWGQPGLTFSREVGCHRDCHGRRAGPGDQQRVQAAEVRRDGGDHAGEQRTERIGRR
jgi:hypothetical protein